MAGVIGCLQAMEAVKFITGAGELLVGKLLTYNALTNDFRTVRLPKKVPGCPVCGEHPTIVELIDYEQPSCDLKGEKT